MSSHKAKGLPPNICTPAELAKLAGVHYSTITNAMKRGSIPYIYLGGVRRINLDDLAQAVDDSEYLDHYGGIDMEALAALREE